MWFLVLYTCLTLFLFCFSHLKMIRLPSGELWDMLNQDRNMQHDVSGSGLGVFKPHFLSAQSTFHLHEIMISQWRDHKLLFSRIPIRHATVNKSLNHCRSGLGQRTIQKPLLQMAH